MSEIVITEMMRKILLLVVGIVGTYNTTIVSTATSSITQFLIALFLNLHFHGEMIIIFYKYILSIFALTSLKS